MKDKKIFIVGVLALSVGFIGGTLYKSSTIQTTPQGRLGSETSFQRGGGFPNSNGMQQRIPRGGNAVNGEVLSKDATSITVKTPDGGSKLIFFSTSTQVDKSSSGTIDDVRPGENVTVTGTQNTDGSVSAQSIHIRPAYPKTPEIK